VNPPVFSQHRLLFLCPALVRFRFSVSSCLPLFTSYSTGQPLYCAPSVLTVSGHSSRHQVAYRLAGLMLPSFHDTPLSCCILVLDEQSAQLSPGRSYSLSIYTPLGLSRRTALSASRIPINLEDAWRHGVRIAKTRPARTQHYPQACAATHSLHQAASDRRLRRSERRPSRNKNPRAARIGKASGAFAHAATRELILLPACEFAQPEVAAAGTRD
jgi:hypothetical protein